MGSKAIQELDPFGLFKIDKKCAAVRWIAKNAPLVDTKVSFLGLKFGLEIVDEGFFEGRECQIDCDCKTKGVEFHGSLTQRGRIKVSFPVGAISAGPGIQIPVNVIGGGEAGGKFETSWNSCTGESKKAGCGYWRVSLGLEGCVTALGGIAKTCLKGECFYNRQYCLGGPSESCYGCRISVSFCYGFITQTCHEYILIEGNNCSDGGVGAG